MASGKTDQKGLGRDTPFKDTPPVTLPLYIVPYYHAYLPKSKFIVNPLMNQASDEVSPLVIHLF